MKLARPLPLALICVAMFGFGFLLVPIYTVFCEWTGINGKTSGAYEASTAELNVEERTIKVQFVSNHNANLGWPFKPVEEQVSVKLGEKRQVMFNVINPTNAPVVAQAVPSVAPSEAAPFLHKIECFCFEQQDLLAGENKNMPLLFFVDSDLPEHITKLTLSYTLFDVTPEADSLAQR
ncbi:cytochrome c oxidase assembly protein [Gammaproteobacteria bacterium 45_16_T64]|nr:cytochrome c oxidase assembly protein [Gammaproteobacteria bacterium 45_16_T64]